jgi:hypothetical protein
MQYKLTLAFMVMAVLAPFRSEAAYAYIASSKAVARDTSSPNPTVTAGASIAMNGLILACGDVFGAENSNGVPTDSLSNTYTAVGLDATSVSLVTTANCWYAINASAGTPTVTFHWTGVTDSTHSYVWGFTGNVTSSVLIDKNKKQLASATAQTCNTSTATKAGQLLIGFIGMDGNSTSFAPGGTETERSEEATDHNDQNEDFITTGSGAIAPTWTLGTAQAGTCISAIFDVLGSTGNIVNPLDGPVKLLRLAR